MRCILENKAKQISLQKMEEIEKIKKLFEKGIVTENGMVRAKIVARFEQIKSKYKRKSDVYFLLSEEFGLSEGRIKNIVTGYYRK